MRANELESYHARTIRTANDKSGVSSYSLDRHTHTTTKAEWSSAAAAAGIVVRCVPGRTELGARRGRRMEQQGVRHAHAPQRALLVFSRSRRSAGVQVRGVAAHANAIPHQPRRLAEVCAAVGRCSGDVTLAGHSAVVRVVRESFGSFACHSEPAKKKQKLLTVGHSEVTRQSFERHSPDTHSSLASSTTTT